MERWPAIPGFDMLRLVGQGTYSHVYHARRTTLFAKSPRAIKVLRDDFAGDAWVRRCFHREGSVGMAVRHRCLAAYHRTMTCDGSFYHVCDYIDGGNLRDAERLPVLPAITVLAQVAGALAALHDAGYIHGDVKPSNILREPSGRAVLIDLGFARPAGLLPFGDGLPGTPNYLAPELCQRAFVDTPAADVFALGVTAYELLEGTLPYPALNENVEVLRQHRNEPPAALSLSFPLALRQLVDGMLQRDLFERPKASRIEKELQAIQRELRKAA